MAQIYRLKSAPLRDLPILYEHYRTLFGSELIPIETMRQWVRRNPYIVWKVLRRARDGTEQMIGFFDIEPLSEFGRDKMHLANATASSLVPDEIFSEDSTKRPSAFYVGSIGCPVGSAARHRGETEVFFLQTVMEVSARSAIELLARPASKAGLHLMKELFEMTPLHAAANKDVIWMVLFNSNTFALPKSYSRISSRLGIKTI